MQELGGYLLIVGKYRENRVLYSKKRYRKLMTGTFFLKYIWFNMDDDVFDIMFF